MTSVARSGSGGTLNGVAAKNLRLSRETTSICFNQLSSKPAKEGGQDSRRRLHGESWRSRPSQPLLARTCLENEQRHGLPVRTSVLVSDGEKMASMWRACSEFADRGRRPRTEYDAHLEISSSTIVSRALLGSTVEQVSAVSPDLNLMPSVSMVLTVARRRRRSANGAFLFGLCAIFGGRGCVGWVVIGHESDTG